VTQLLPWQQNLLAQLVALLSTLGTLLLILNPRLLYLENK
jgi:hypothetical protein